MSTEIEIVGYLRASPDGQPEWSEDCVCEEAVYPNYDGDESVSMPICRLADASAVIAQRDARIAGLERDLSLAHMACGLAEEELAALKAKPSAQEQPKQQCPVTGAITYIDPADMGIQQPSGVVDERVEFDVAWPSIAAELPSHQRSQYSAGDVYAAEQEAALEGWKRARLNPCRAQAVPGGIHDQHRKAMKLLREVRSWIIPKGNISMSIIDRVGAFLDSATPSAQQEVK